MQPMPNSEEANNGGAANLRTGYLAVGAANNSFVPLNLLFE
jgi:hypothetical protein